MSSSNSRMPYFVAFGVGGCVVPIVAWACLQSTLVLVFVTGAFTSLAALSYVSRKRRSIFQGLISLIVPPLSVEEYAQAPPPASRTLTPDAKPNIAISPPKAKTGTSPSPLSSSPSPSLSSSPPLSTSTSERATDPAFTVEKRRGGTSRKIGGSRLASAGDSPLAKLTDGKRTPSKLQKETGADDGKKGVPRSITSSSKKSRHRRTSIAQPLDSVSQKNFLQQSTSVLTVDRGNDLMRPKILHRGWLSIQSHATVKKTWSKRYFVLRDTGWMTYYSSDDEQNRTCYHHISLHGCVLSVRKSKKKFKFRITQTQKKPIYHRHIPGENDEATGSSRGRSTRCYVRGNSEAERQEWVTVINAVISNSARMRYGMPLQDQAHPLNNSMLNRNFNSVPVHRPNLDSGGNDTDMETDLSDDSSSEEEDIPDDEEDMEEEVRKDRGSVELPRTRARDDSDLEQPIRGHRRSSSHSTQQIQTVLSNSAGTESTSPATPPVAMPAEKQSMLKFLKSIIGMDVTRISMPVSYFEPSSFLQRMSETCEYHHLLDKADQCANPMQALVYISLFAISYHPCNLRLLKPFNPMLGETFEYVDGDYRYLSEQVSHHPPVGAMYAESNHFQFWRTQGLKTKFAGNSLDVSPTGVTVLKLKSSGQEFQWSFIRARVHNIILGGMYVDQYGDMSIVNDSTGDHATVKFAQTGYFGRNQYETKVSVSDSSNTEQIRVEGKYNDTMSLKDDKLKLKWDFEKDKVLWHYTPHTLKGSTYKLSRYATELNKVYESGDHHKWPLPETDSRLRGDRAALERDDTEGAEEAKRDLEQIQRDKRKLREDNGTDHIPMFFEETTQAGTEGQVLWRYNNKYWDD
eukprot:TRINITY_DN633_c0_g3_i1.p1 TRINITY_DN633_c0_g3~~TRINITY_DN633_c0_g3_i1.p1  ORF type:complete len:856 (-),score=217.23 TRINITY_DN633_c0_g3_i1:160-2727(-)